MKIDNLKIGDSIRWIDEDGLGMMNGVICGKGDKSSNDNIEIEDLKWSFENQNHGKTEVLRSGMWIEVENEKNTLG